MDGFWKTNLNWNRAGARCQLSVVSCQWSVVSGQWSVVSCQWSVVSCQLSVVSCQLSVVSCQLSASSVGQASAVTLVSCSVHGGRQKARACYRDHARRRERSRRTAHGVGLLPRSCTTAGAFTADGTRGVPATEITRDGGSVHGGRHTGCACYDHARRREHCPAQFDRFLCDSAACRPALSRVGNYKWARWGYFEFSATECHLVPWRGGPLPCWSPVSVVSCQLLVAKGVCRRPRGRGVPRWRRM